MIVSLQISNLIHGSWEIISPKIASSLSSADRDKISSDDETTHSVNRNCVSRGGGGAPYGAHALYD